MKFWKEHTSLRVALIALFFFLGLGLVIYGWTLTGKLSGLGLMIVVFCGVCPRMRILFCAYLYVWDSEGSDGKRWRGYGNRGWCVRRRYNSRKYAKREYGKGE